MFLYHPNEHIGSSNIGRISPVASAVAAPLPAMAAASAVAERVFTWEELLEIAGSRPTQKWALNSQALKYTRHLGEDPPGVLKEDRVECQFGLDQVVCIGEMEHSLWGPGFSFDSPAVAGKMLRWSPAQFLTQLREDALDTLGLRQHGVRKLVCLPFEKSVDKMRLTAAIQAGQPFADGVVPPLWDFVLTRGDGVMFALHPSFKGFKCRISPLEGLQVRRAQAEARGVRAWELDQYPVRGHGRYQEGDDLVRDQHRRLHLEKNKAHGKGSPAVAGQSSYVGGGPLPALMPPSPAPALMPPSPATVTRVDASVTSARVQAPSPLASSSAVAEPSSSSASSSESWWWDRRLGRWMYWDMSSGRWRDW